MIYGKIDNLPIWGEKVPSNEYALNLNPLIKATRRSLSARAIFCFSCPANGTAPVSVTEQNAARR